MGLDDVVLSHGLARTTSVNFTAFPVNAMTSAVLIAEIQASASTASARYLILSDFQHSFLP